MRYAWNIEETQGGENVHVTVMIYDGDTEKITSNYIGEFTIFFKDEAEVLEFFERGLAEYRGHHETMNHLRGLTSTARKME